MAFDRLVWMSMATCRVDDGSFLHSLESEPKQLLLFWFARQENIPTQAETKKGIRQASKLRLRFEGTKNQKNRKNIILHRLRTGSRCDLILLYAALVYASLRIRCVITPSLFLCVVFVFLVVFPVSA